MASLPTMVLPLIVTWLPGSTWTPPPYPPL